MKAISRGTLLRMFLRSFFLQGSFSAKYRQNLGFAFCMEPAGKRLWENPEDYRRFMIRHSEHYNGNPFMVTLVLGAAAHMEESLKNNEGVSEDDIRQFKKIVGPATGSTGDRLFWSNLRPFALIAGVICALTYGVWGAVVFLGLFNVVVWYLKLRWLSAGYRLGPKVVIEVRNKLIDQTERFLQILGSMLAGFAAPGLMAAVIVSPLEPAVRFGGATVVFLVSIVMLRRNVPLYIAFPGASGAALILGLTASVW
ncbi:PTS system mannose/fructose/sorbose family transporter subunit IID [Candidatus Latescibacterota bacterium]